MLKLENVTGGYVNIPVLKKISFEVADGELVGLIGLMVLESQRRLRKSSVF